MEGEETKDGGATEIPATTAREEPEGKQGSEHLGGEKWKDGGPATTAEAAGPERQQEPEGKQGSEHLGVEESKDGGPSTTVEAAGPERQQDAGHQDASVTTHLAPEECIAAFQRANAAIHGEQFEQAVSGFRQALEHLRSGSAEAATVAPELRALELQLLDGIAVSLQKADKQNEALDAHVCTVSTASSYRLHKDEAMACLGIADMYAAGEASELLEAPGALLGSLPNVDDKILHGVGRTRVPTLHHILHDAAVEDLSLEDALPSMAAFLQSQAAQEWERVTKDKVFGSKLHLLESIQWSERAAHLAAEHGHHDVRAQALGSLGTIYQALQQHDLALRLFQEVLAEGQSMSDQQAIANALQGIGRALDSKAYKDLKCNWLNFSSLQTRAIQAHDDACSAFSSLGDSRETVQCYMRMAQGYSLLREHHTAIAKFRSAEQLAKGIGEDEAQADAVREIGLQYQLLAQHRNAILMHEMDYKMRQKLKNRSGVGRASCHLAISKRAMGSFKEAHKLSDFALKIAEENNDEEAQARALIEMGSVFAATNQARTHFLVFRMCPLVQFLVYFSGIACVHSGQCDQICNR